MRVLPAIDAPVAFVGDFRLAPGLALELDLSRFRYVDFELLVENDAAVSEVVTGPKLAGRERVHDGADELVLQYVAGTQRRDGDVLLVVVGVDGRVGDGEVLDGG